jgi:aspartate aminotransferase
MVMISRKIAENLTKTAWIRAMFEKGEELRKIHGEDKVYDFSIGNPEAAPPKAVIETLKQFVLEDHAGRHRYMSNAGYYDVREKVAAYVQKEQGIPMTASNIVMTCGAAGALNVVIKTLLDEGDEVIVFSPYFVEYLTFIENHSGVPVVAAACPDTFLPDVTSLQKAITQKTKALILNNPNNPTGVIYDQKTLTDLASALEEAEKRIGHPIYVILDEPYSKIVYDGAVVPRSLQIFRNSILVNSFSKSHAIPGERIGYIAASSAIEDLDILMRGLVSCNRSLGFVNAPSLFQRVVAETLDEVVDIEWYQRRRDLLYHHLLSAGFSCNKPQGAYYLFLKSPVPDDVAFVENAMKYNILLVPGSGFGFPGYARLSYCISWKVIENSLPAFSKLAADYGL